MKDEYDFSNAERGRFFRHHAVMVAKTDLMLDDYVANLDADTRAAGEKAAKPWIDAAKPPKT